jgi:class 3 adenylate cyclase
MSMSRQSGKHHEAELDRHISGHAPRDRFDPTRTTVSTPVRQAIMNRSPVHAIVLVADIRRSAGILKESIDIPHYASVLEDFVGEFRTVLSYHGGWFDKFTGDGFICYWLVEDAFAERMDTVLDFSCSVMDNFRRYYYPAFVANMRNVPTGIGLSIGVDAGPCYLLPIAGDLTIIGSPIVGSVRMNAACEPYQAMLNTFAGSRLMENVPGGEGRLSADLSYKVTAGSIETKEYPLGQEVYTVEFFKKGQRLVY